MEGRDRCRGGVARQRVIVAAVVAQLLLLGPPLSPPGSLAGTSREGGTTVTPHFVLDETKLALLRTRVESLAIGAHRDEVLRTVGQPDREFLAGPKQAKEWTHRFLVYDVKTIGVLPGNVHDQLVEMVFDRRDRLVEVRSNVEGIRSRGSLDQ